MGLAQFISKLVRNNAAFLSVLVLSLAITAALIWIGTNVVSFLEPTAELGGPDHDWAADIRNIVTALSTAAALVLCRLSLLRPGWPRYRGCKLHEVAKPANFIKTSIDRQRVTQTLIIFVVIPVIANCASWWFVYNKTLGACDFL